MKRETREMPVLRMDFSGAPYGSEQGCREVPYGQMIRIDLTDVRGTNCYCSPEAADEIRRRIAPFPAEGVHLIDSGNYHYATLFWLEKIGEPYELLVYDHHTDMQASVWGDDLPGCGSWIREALRRRTPGKDFLRQLLIIGPEPEVLCRDMKALEADGIQCPARTDQKELPVYLSVDKDILSKSELDTNWDQGSMGLRALADDLRRICRGRRIIGADLCGTPDAGAPAKEWEKNARADRLLLDALYEVL